MRLMTFCILATGLASAVTTRATASSTDVANARGVLTVAVASDSSPFHALQGQTPAGLDADLLTRFRATETQPVHVRVMPSSDMPAALADGIIDIAAASLPVTEDTQKTVAFAPPDGVVTLYYLTRAQDSGIHSLSDLGGRKFGIITNSRSIEQLTELEHRVVKAGGALGPVVSFETVEHGLAGLSDGKIEYLVDDIATLSVATAGHPGEYTFGTAVSQPRYAAWATAKGKPELIAALADFMLKERSNGELDALQQKWLHHTFDGMPEAAHAQNWWLARTDRPKELPIPTLRDPD